MMNSFAFSAFFWRISSFANRIYSSLAKTRTTSSGEGYSPAQLRPHSWRREISSASLSFTFAMLFKPRKQRGLACQLHTVHIPELQGGCVRTKSLHSGRLVCGHVASSHGLLHDDNLSSLGASILLVILVVVIIRAPSAASLGLLVKKCANAHGQVVTRNPLLFVVHGLLLLFFVFLFDSLLLPLGSWLLPLILFNNGSYRLFFHGSLLFLLGNLGFLGLGNGSGGSFSSGSGHFGSGLFTADEPLSDNHPRGDGSGSDRSFDSGRLILYGSSFHSSNMRFPNYALSVGNATRTC